MTFFIFLDFFKKQKEINQFSSIKDDLRDVLCLKKKLLVQQRKTC